MSADRTCCICGGPRCTHADRARALAAHLEALLGEQAHPDHPQHVACLVTPCLSVCIDGPVMVVHPDRVWYRLLDEEVLHRIVAEHLRGGVPVCSHTFDRLTFGPR